jgi:putative tryptophan/tyrosine transport system substrate-binding protein
MTLRRREFITLLGGAAAASPLLWPLMARAQQRDRVRRVAVLFGIPESDPKAQQDAAIFRQELATHGWSEGRNLQIDFRFAVQIAAVEDAMMELLQLKPDVIYSWGGATTRVARQQAQTIPIVFTGPSTPVEDVNVARPQGNITGFPFLYPSIAGKWVELIKEADPRVTWVAVVIGPETTANSDYLPFIKQAAASLGVSANVVRFEDASGFERAIDAFASIPNGGLISVPGNTNGARENEDLLRKLAVKHRLPVVHWDSAYPADGGLMSYASSFEDLHRRAAGYVDRLLRGAKVSDLPIERPSKFELIVNVKAAKAIGLAIPEALLLRADRVIE